MRWWESAWARNAWDGALPWPILVIGATVFLVVLLIRGARTPTGRRNSARLTPFEILRERFARGEIDQAEYEKKRRIISQG
jgi:putative membrane protein